MSGGILGRVGKVAASAIDAARLVRRLCLVRRQRMRGIGRSRVGGGVGWGLGGGGLVGGSGGLEWKSRRSWLIRTLTG